MPSKDSLILRKPEWLKVKLLLTLPEKVRNVSRKYRLNTICEEAACPNINECWRKGTATFMILGVRCTRSCSFCNIKSANRFVVDMEEPKRIAEAVKELSLNHTVITSVTRDDLKDGGASIFAETVSLIRRYTSSTIEVLIPDLRGSIEALRTVVGSGPDILGHNIETVRRLYPYLRSGADYIRSLEVLKRAKSLTKRILTKTGILLGFGEEEVEILETMRDIRETGCDILTIGQYLPPSRRHYPLKRYYSPEEFKRFELIGKDMGFMDVNAGPLVRSSYNGYYKGTSRNPYQ